MSQHDIHSILFIKRLLFSLSLSFIPHDHDDYDSQWPWNDSSSWSRKHHLCENVMVNYGQCIIRGCNLRNARHHHEMSQMATRHDLDGNGSLLVLHNEVCGILWYSLFRPEEKEWSHHQASCDTSWNHANVRLVGSQIHTRYVWRHGRCLSHSVWTSQGYPTRCYLRKMPSWLIDNDCCYYWWPLISCWFCFSCWQEGTVLFSPSSIPESTSWCTFIMEWQRSAHTWVNISSGRNTWPASKW